MLEMVYGSSELSRTRFASSPIMNLVDGVFIKDVGGSKSLMQQRWWRTARRLVPARAIPLIELINAAPEFPPGFLYPDAAAESGTTRPSLDLELDALRSLSAERIAAEAAAFSRASQLAPPRLWEELRDNVSSTVPRLVDMARALFTECMAADWPDLQRRIDAEIALRGHQVASRGLAAVLNALHPRLSWRNDVLGVSSTRMWAEVQGLDGRGFVLVPNVMITGMTAPITGATQPLLGYSHGAGPAPTPARSSALATLVGSGRARALRVVAEGCSTAELATRLGVSSPTASEQASALRAAGLLVTLRTGQSVRHSLTELGAKLLAANEE